MITAARRAVESAPTGCAPASVYHVLGAGGPACGLPAVLDLGTQVDADLVPTLLRCGRLGCREAWPGAEKQPLVVYTDGSGTVASLPCGAGVVVYDGDPAAASWDEDGPQPVFEASFHLGLGTNNHAELCAIGIALAVTNEPPFQGRYVILRSDSEYALHMVRGRGPLDPERSNARVINRIRYALRGRQLRFEHVRGHSKIPGNERADHLASIGRKRGIPAKETAA